MNWKRKSARKCTRNPRGSVKFLSPQKKRKARQKKSGHHRKKFIPKKMQDSVHAIVYVSSKNQSKNGELINAGVTGISGYVDGFGTWSQKLMCREFVLPLTTEVLYRSNISFTVSADEIDHDAPLDKKYDATKYMTVAILHENNRIQDIPYFSVEALDQARRAKDELDERHMKSGTFIGFHVGGPVVQSVDKSVQFAFNDDEMSTCGGLFTLAYQFEDSFGSCACGKSYKKMLQEIERTD